ncbi:MAG TPA: WYL domain-containing protein [Thermoanaerobaculia bacterium]|nr:WYL domain-containing protein [Thermoanaerobaculia bacterium]
MRADRLLSALLLLQAHGRMTSRQLATRLEISERTAHRDMEALSAAGVPVLSVRGSRGGWQLDEQWRTRVPGLDEAELRAFLMAQPRVIGDAPLAAAAERAVDKLMAALPPSMRERATSIRQRLFVDTTGWYGSVEDLSALPLVQDAVSRDRKLAFRYKAEERTVDPLGLVAKGTSWYLVANTANGYRTFRVSRMQQVRVIDVLSERPAGFDLAEHWNASTREFRERSVQFEATLRLDPTAAAELKQWRPVSHLTTEDDGWIQLRTSFADADHARFVVLGLGPRATVLAPDSLREQVAADIEAAFERLHEKAAG